MKFRHLTILILLFSSRLIAQNNFINADSLRGHLGSSRDWWDVQFTDLTVEIPNEYSRIQGTNKLTFTWDAKKFEQNFKSDKGILQIDLQSPMQIDRLLLNGEPMQINSERNAHFISVDKKMLRNENELVIDFSGTPRKAVTPPWDGGIIYKKDKNNLPWISVACQGLGASVWYPCKDHQSDEANRGSRMTILHDSSLQAVGNGRLVSNTIKGGKKHTVYEIKSPINSYNFVFYIGDYVTTSWQADAVSGKLDMSFSYLREDSSKIDHVINDMNRTLKAFEYWFGPFPWYEDGYRLVQAPHLGMEHQSAVAYGNGFKNGYRGKDLSKTGLGKNWDYIVVHETGHEWWGNHITTNDICDMWIHEGFTTFSEGLFVDYYQPGKGKIYTRGMRSLVNDDAPIVARRGLNKEPSGDQYYKGANILNHIRRVVNNDSLFRSMLHHLQKKYGRATVNSIDIEKEISSYTKINWQPFFDQYLYTNEIPLIQYKRNKDKVTMKLTRCNTDLILPLLIFTKSGPEVFYLKPNESVEFTPAKKSKKYEVIDQFNYVELEEI